MGYTKIAISLPKEVADQLEEFAQDSCLSRSKVVVSALEAMFRQRRAADLTEAYNTYADSLTDRERDEDTRADTARAADMKRALGPWDSGRA